MAAYSNSVLNLQRGLLWARSQNTAIDSVGRLDNTWGQATAAAFDEWMNYSGGFANGRYNIETAASMVISPDRHQFSFADSGSALAVDVSQLIATMPRAFRTLGSTSAPTTSAPPGTTPAPATPAGPTTPWDATLNNSPLSPTDAIAQAQAQAAAAQTLGQNMPGAAQAAQGGYTSLLRSLTGNAQANSTLTPAGAAAAQLTANVVQGAASQITTYILIGGGVLVAGVAGFLLWRSTQKKGRRRR